jgi:hypothetical protein
MQGDYARVLHKLSSLLRKNNREIEAIEMETEAIRIRMERSPVIQTDTMDVVANRDLGGVSEQSEEKPYDNLVYALWR